MIPPKVTHKVDNTQGENKLYLNGALITALFIYDTDNANLANVIQTPDNYAIVWVHGAAALLDMVRLIERATNHQNRHQFVAFVEDSYVLFNRSSNITPNSGQLWEAK
jgi:hypothetical protein